MPDRPFTRIERANLVLALAVTAVGGLVWGRAGMVSAGLGAVLACANFLVISRLAGRALARVAHNPDSDLATSTANGLVARLAIKMLAFMAVLWIVLTVFDILLAPFALGLSVFVISILAVGASLAAREAGNTPPSATQHTEESH